ncbi:reverse transcriptase domain-containing protein [Roseovarius azorensis]|nr:reverse transcriptase domain-containing protein [Roseovarius azorensis]
MGLDLTRRIYSLWTPPRIFFHHRNGGHVSAIARHLDNSYLSHLDINRFFYRIRKNRIIKSLKRIGFSFDDANEAAAHSVVKTEDGFSLPYGFTQSPVLASLCLDWSPCGAFLRKIPKEFRVSVYVDDIILSHANDRDALLALSNELVECFRSCGFPVSEDKMTLAETEIVSFNIRLSRGKLVITPDRIQEFYNQIALNFENDYVLDGIEGYVRTVNSAQADDVGAAIGRARARRTVG